MNSIIDQLSMVAIYTLNFLNDLEMYESFLIWMHILKVKIWTEGQKLYDIKLTIHVLYTM